MTRKHLLAGASALAVSVLVASPAFAAGTAAGSAIVNNVTVNYQVGGVSQSQLAASNTLTVDRRVTLTVTEPGNAATTVAPGQTAAYTTFTVSNTSNATLDLGLSFVQPNGGATAHGGTDNFDLTGVTIYNDTNTNGVYDPGTDVAVTYLDEVAADASRTVFVVGNVPIARVNGDDAGITLTAQARESGTAGTQGIVVTETSGANTAGMDTVLADTAGFNDAARDGQFSARDDFSVAGAQLTVTKTSTIVSDPVNGTTNPKMIPGAVVTYCILVANATGSAPATNVAISDPLPTQTTYVAGSANVNGTVTGGVCGAAPTGTVAGSFASNTVSGTIPSVAAGETKTLYFNVTIN